MEETTARVLIVDDEVGMREGCRRALTRYGFQVETAENGADALPKLREGSYDLVLLDAMMPGMSGLELLERIQERDPDAICVMITGYATVDLAAQAMKQGAQGFLPKPFTSDELLSAVRRGLEERARRLSLKEQLALEEERRQAERARQEVAKLDAFESRFMLVLVHELRNPAGVIKNYLQLMRAGYVDDDEWDAYLEKLDLRATQLLNMLDQLLELAHLKETSGPAKARPVPVAEVMAAVVEQMRPAAEAKGLTLELAAGARPVVLGDAGHIRSLWSQLVDNAIRYTPRGRIRLAVVEDNGWIEATVSDTGIGLGPEELTRIFQDFYRSEAARAEVELGTGLGLAIVNQIVKLYDGTIQVESAPGQGCTFTVRLPAAPAES